MSRVQKEEQLNGLTQLVTGIRLFNKQLGKGGEGVVNLPALCADELQDLTTTVGQMTTETEEHIQFYQGISFLVVIPVAVLEYSIRVPDTLPAEISITTTKRGLAFRRQLLMYLDALQDQMIRSRSSLIQLSTKFDDSITELKTNCRAKTAVSVDQVYVLLWYNFRSLISLCYPLYGQIGSMNYFYSPFAVESYRY